MHPTQRAAILALILTFVVKAQGPTISGCPVLPADNIWNTPVDKLPVHPDSAAYISTMGSGLPLRPDFGSGYWSGGLFGMPFVKVRGTQTKYPATFTYASESDPGPYAVPLDAPIEGGSASTGDRHAIAIDTDNCILYELFAAYPQAASWKAGGGAIFDLRSHALRPATWTSADAAGLPIMPGLIRYDEIVAGEVRHALRVVASQTQRAFVWPARHYASSITDTRYPPMGLRLRLRASFDETPYPPEIQIIMRGLKKYGMMVADNGTSWFFGGEPDPRWNNDMLRKLLDIKGSDFEAVDVSSLMIDPNSGQAKQASTSVAVTPASVTVITQANRQFTANQPVTWLVNGIAGGNSQVGYIDANGLYSAPSAVPVPATVQVQAKTASSTGTASVTIVYPAPAISGVSPSSVAVGTFTLTVNGTNFQTGAVVKLGGAPLVTAFSSSSRLTATGSAATLAAAVAVTVVNPDGQTSNAANIAVTGTVTSEVKVSITPAAAVVRTRAQVQFTATVQNTANKQVIWKVDGIVRGNATVGTINDGGRYTAPIVALARPVLVSATSVADPSKTATAAVQIVRR